MYRRLRSNFIKSVRETLLSLRILFAKIVRKKTGKAMAKTTDNIKTAGAKNSIYLTGPIVKVLNIFNKPVTVKPIIA